MRLFVLANCRQIYKVKCYQGLPPKQRVGLVPASLAVDSVLH